MTEVFACIGMVIAVFGFVVVITGITGVMTDDDDFCVRWLMTCLLYAITVTMYYMTSNK